MAKLYPPIIEGVLPAFSGTTLVVPFSMNRGVGASEIDGFVFKLKTSFTNEILITGKTTDYNLTKGQAQFIISEENIEKLQTGTFYKLQLCYRGGGEDGLYSTVGVIKFTDTPKIKLDCGTELYCSVEYSCEKDPTEKLYSSYFELRDRNNNILETSEVRLHNSLEDTGVSYKQNELYRFKYVNTTGKDQDVYPIFYYTTINNITGKFYNINENTGNPVLIKLSSTAKGSENEDEFSVVSHAEDGYIEFLVADKNATIYKIEDNLKYELSDKKKDFFVEHGETAQYQCYARGLYFNATVESPLMEHTYLVGTDGRQLKLAYNPQVSVYKTNVAETKVDTIGSKFPFFIRNGSIEYHEFSINGLISYLMDDQEFFCLNHDEELNIRTGGYRTTTETGAVERYNVPTTGLVDYNITAEKRFKNMVLNWLNDGKPKVFKSATEGNFIVRIMNVSSSPENGLGRMLHNFSCSAYECEEYNLSNLQKLGFIKVGDN